MKLLFIVLWCSLSPFLAFAKYNETEAILLAKMAETTYTLYPDKCFAALFADNKDYEFVKLLSRPCDILGNYCRGIVAANRAEKQLYVAFMGTKLDAQLFIESLLSISPTRRFGNLGLSNDYFTDALEALWGDLLTVIMDKQFVNYNVTFTGHSLGAAITSLAALKTVYFGLKPSSSVRMINFGQPRVGNHDLAHAMNRLVPESYRLIHTDDFVPHLIPCEFALNSTLSINGTAVCKDENSPFSFHHGTEVWYPGDMTPNKSNYSICTGAPFGEDPSCSNLIQFNVFGDVSHYWKAHQHYFNHKINIPTIYTCKPWEF
uniref:Lipase_3 domain-containing protein n=1 Tax=Panagrellus redivivus TaxID=6233 RepID=A0A7E4ZV18_PANRE